MKNELTKTIKNLEELIDEKNAQINAIQYALSLVEQKHKSACDMVENVPNNVYIEDWKREKDYTQKQAQELRAIWQSLSEDLDQLCNQLNRLEKAQAEEEQRRKDWEEQQRAKASQQKQKGYIMRTLTTNLETKEVREYFRGVDGYIQEDPQYWTPYKRKGQLLNIIKKEAQRWGNMSHGKTLDEVSYTFAGWLYENEIIEVYF